MRTGMHMLRQGDVLLIKIPSLPKTQLMQEKGCILAYGEATGHSHGVYEHGRIWVDITDNGRRYLEVLQDTSLRHQEHEEIALKGPAVYEIVRQVEYRPGAIRHVID